jgi:predicted MPP superfamily phosphohydrolase
MRLPEFMLRLSPMPRWLIFALVGTLFVVVLGGSHHYLYRRMRAAGFLAARRARLVVAVALGALALWFPLSYLLLHARYCALTCALHWLAAFWLGLLLYLVLYSLFGQLVLLAVRLVSRRRPANQRLVRWAFVLGCAAAAGTAAWGVYEARCAAGTTRVDVSIRDLPAGLAGFTIAQISDVHVGPIIGTDRLARVVEQVNGLKPDLVVITGDLVDQDAELFQAMSGPLARLRARLGVFAVTGNHEFLSDVTAAVKHASAASITFLRNEKRVLEHGLLLYGVDDPTGQRMGFAVPDPTQVIGPEAKQAPAILLYHRPVGLERVAPLGIDLMLSGHTHRGQLWPLTYISRLIFPRQYGLYRHGRGQLFVSRGIGTWGPPMRVAAPPEVVLITLRRGR